MTGRRGRRGSKKPPTGNDLTEAATDKSKAKQTIKHRRVSSTSDSSSTPPPRPQSRRSHSIPAPGPSRPRRQRRSPSPDQPPPPPRRTYGDPKGTGPDTHGFEAIIGHISAPIPNRTPIYIVVDSAHMAVFFSRMRTVIIELLYPGSEGEPAGVINDNQFVWVCRYLTKARIDTVHFKFSGLRTEGRLPLPMEVIVPQALSDIINGIGVVIVSGGGKVLVPQPEAIPADVAIRLNNRVTHAIFTNFSILINQAISRGFIRGSTIIGTTEGTAWWALSCRNAADEAVSNGDANNVIVKSLFNEFTPRDTIYASVVQNQFNGNVPHHD